MYRGNRASHDVAHNWAHQLNSKYKKDTGNGSNFYYEGKVIYSYGRHFPIAVIGFKDRKKNKDIDELIEFANNSELVVFFTLRTYSNTTTKHINSVSSACSHLDVIYCKNPDEAFRNYHENNLVYWENRAKEQAQKLAKAKKPEKYFGAIAHLLEQAGKYAAYFNIRLSKRAYPNLFITADAKTLEAIKKRQKVAEQAKERLFNEELRRFRTFTTKAGDFSDNITGVLNPKDHNRAYLRYNERSKRIETSKGIQIPAEIAKRFYKWLQKIKNVGCSGNCTESILNYRVHYVNANEFEIGCHTIHMSEANAIAKLLGW